MPYLSPTMLLGMLSKSKGQILRTVVMHVLFHLYTSASIPTSISGAPIVAADKFVDNSLQHAGGRGDLKEAIKAFQKDAFHHWGKG